MVKMKVIFDKEKAKELKEEYLKQLGSLNCNGFKKIKSVKYFNLKDDTISYLKRKYEVEEYGLKSLGDTIGLTYTQIRRYFKYLNVKLRTGRSITTKRMSKFRSEKAIKEKTFVDWTVRFKGFSKGVAGYYLRKDNKYCWLRSTWEFIYAKWLDKNNIIWDVECKLFKMKDGTNYRPDFFIFDDQKKLIGINEIKGYNKERSYKVDLLKQQLKDENIIVSIVENILPYIEKGLNYHKELRQWKKIRLSEQQLKELQSKKTKMSMI